MAGVFKHKDDKLYYTSWVIPEKKSDLVWNVAGSWRPNFELKNKTGDRLQDCVSKTVLLSLA